MSGKIDYRKLFDWDYLNQAPEANFLFFWPLVAILLVSLVSGILIAIFVKTKPFPAHTKKLLKWLAAWLIFPVPFGLVLVLARNQAIQPINQRLFLLIFLFIWLAGFLGLAIYRISGYKKLAYQYWLWQEKNKYLPKSNRAKSKIYG